jgi:hypothetical protein
VKNYCLELPAILGCVAWPLLRSAKHKVRHICCLLQAWLQYHLLPILHGVIPSIVCLTQPCFAWPLLRCAKHKVFLFAEFKQIVVLYVSDGVAFNHCWYG